MAIKTITDTSVTVRHDGLLEDLVVPVASLVAGVGDDHDAIQMPPFSNGSILFLTRTYTNPLEYAKVTNALHALLVSLNQIDALSSAYLLAEDPLTLPLNTTTLTGSPITIYRGTGGEFATDLDMLTLIKGATAARQDLELGILYPSQDDSAIATWVSTLYATDDVRQKRTLSLTNNKIKVGLP